MVGRAYRAALQVVSHSPGVEVLGCAVPPELGLHFDVASQTLHGLPQQAGEFSLQVAFRFAQDLRASPRLEQYPCLLIINPDPRSLWKDLPSDTQAPYYRPDTDAGLHIAGMRRVAYASRRGRAHAHVGGCRDDAVWVTHDPATGWTVMAVADGAGSARLARQGAQLAVTTAGQHLAAALVGTPLAALALQRDSDPGLGKALAECAYMLFGRAAWAALKAIEAEAEAAGQPPKAFATTLLLAIHQPTAQGQVVAAFGVGDGAIGLYRDGQEALLLQQVDSGEFAGQTRFLDRGSLSDAQGILARIQVRVVPDLTALLLMTDGVSDARFNSDAELRDLVPWTRLWQELAPVLAQEAPEAALLTWLDFWSPGNHDDRTLAVLW